MSTKAFWSWRDICEAKGTSLSTEKREQATDPDYPTKVLVSPSRVAHQSYVRLWLKADIGETGRNVRFTPRSGHWRGSH